jgi:hypothetical protein
MCGRPDRYGETVADDGRREQPERIAQHDCGGDHHKDKRAADEVQPPAHAAAMLRQIEGIELLEASVAFVHCEPVTAPRCQRDQHCR